MADTSFFTIPSSSDAVQRNLRSSSPDGSCSSLLPDSSPPSSVSVVSATTHDTRRTKYHLDELGTFAKRLEDAAASVFPNRGRCRYNDVQVLLLRWEEDDMGVSWELDDLAITLKNAYGFNTETWHIPTTQPHLTLMGKAFKMVQDFGKKDNLLIVYYAGHGGMNSSRQPLWTCSSHPNSPSLQWYAIQTIFEQADSDTLLLLDCCAAASGAPADGQCLSVTETIAACGFETWAPQPGRHSFTNTLIAVLEEWCDRPSFTAAMLHCEVLNRLRHEKPERKGNVKKFECRRTPIHIVSTADAGAGSVELRQRRSGQNDAKMESPQRVASMNETRDDMGSSGVNEVTSGDASKDIESLYDPDSLTKVLENTKTALPQVLISLALEEEQLLDVDQCLRWLHRFPALAKYAKVQGVYRSNSTLLIMSLPVLIWDWIPDDPACSFIGYVHSSNLLALECDEGDLVGSKLKLERDLQPQSGVPDDLTTETRLTSNYLFGHVPFVSGQYIGREPVPELLPSIGDQSRTTSYSSRRMTPPCAAEGGVYTSSNPFVQPHLNPEISDFPKVLRAQEASTIQSFRQRVSSVGPGSQAWTVHVSLLPTSSQPFPFEKDTTAYKRCLSRGLHQMVVVPDSDSHSFKVSIDQAFSIILHGRPWLPLVARICDAKNLRGLPMLRQLPTYLIGSDYNAEFLQHNCAVVDESGKILDLYIAMSEDTISWAELREITPFIPGLESAWIYDPYLDEFLNKGLVGASINEWHSSSRRNEFSSSVDSVASQSNQRLQAQINLAVARPLIPKGGEDTLMSQDNSSHSMNRLDSKDGSSDKVAISSKTTYQRPKHDRVYCKQCDSHQEGFRGEHDLRRHMDREHKTLIKKWVCEEPKDGLNHPKPVLPLSKCKACTQQKKRYGAYYNAAAHLRRAHFQPKVKSKSKDGSKIENEGERRGAKGGGDWPPMSELKFWMREVETVEDSQHPDSPGTDDFVEDDALFPAYPSASSSVNFSSPGLDELLRKQQLIQEEIASLIPTPRLDVLRGKRQRIEKEIGSLLPKPRSDVVTQGRTNEQDTSHFSTFGFNPPNDNLASAHSPFKSANTHWWGSEEPDILMLDGESTTGTSNTYSYEQAKFWGL